MNNLVEIIKVSVGPILALTIPWLAWAIIHGNVQEKNSFGLNGIFTILGALSTAYSLHYYGQRGNGNGGQK